MGPVAAVAIPAAASLLGGFMANRGRSKEAQKDRNFQERMSSTSWQRGKADMEAAGINPALAYSQGGASSPGGAMAPQEDIVSGAVTSAQHARRLKKELSVMDMQIVKDRAAANASKTQAHRNIQLELNDEVMGRQLQLQMPWLQHVSRAQQKYGGPAAVAQLLLSSGGSQLAGVAGAGIAGSIFRNARLGPKRGPNPTYPGRLSGRGR